MAREEKRGKKIKQREMGLHIPAMGPTRTLGMGGPHTERYSGTRGLSSSLVLLNLAGHVSAGSPLSAQARAVVETGPVRHQSSWGWKNSTPLSW
ncbi:unnamed protein product [Spirodela intermedia]|uniref:Uncharacterized protein n=1 Tax=Spirodela intermedia TaxID=51605 RepID=A0A7I8JHA4_SPIIN|nr:unnamed protein product [Spirodela intermedia]CAA6668923.1 unnamed protein product [Spirodela intermedia]